VPPNWLRTASFMRRRGAPGPEAGDVCGGSAPRDAAPGVVPPNWLRTGAGSGRSAQAARPIDVVAMSASVRSRGNEGLRVTAFGRAADASSAMLDVTFPVLAVLSAHGPDSARRSGGRGRRRGAGR